MKTVLGADGKIGIPNEIRQTDHLVAGDSFEVRRLNPGHYLLAKKDAVGSAFTVVTGEDGLPVIRTESGVITSHLVKELECHTP